MIDWYSSRLETFIRENTPERIILETQLLRFAESLGVSVVDEDGTYTVAQNEELIIRLHGLTIHWNNLRVSPGDTVVTYRPSLVADGSGASDFLAFIGVENIEVNLTGEVVTIPLPPWTCSRPSNPAKSHTAFRSDAEEEVRLFIEEMRNFLDK